MSEGNIYLAERKFLCRLVLHAAHVPVFSEETYSLILFPDIILSFGVAIYKLF